jgi:5-methylcytosine-specific restriction enzyme A
MTRQGWNTGRVNTRRWRRTRAYVLARDKWVCQMRLPGCTSTATTADHVVPLVMGGDPYDPGNARAACAWCNSSAGGALSSRRDLGVPSREW